MTFIKVIYIITEQGEFLYNPVTLKVYTREKPHKLIGYLDKKTLDVCLQI